MSDTDRIWREIAKSAKGARSKWRVAVGRADFAKVRTHPRMSENRTYGNRRPPAFGLARNGAFRFRRYRASGLARERGMVMGDRAHLHAYNANGNGRPLALDRRGYGQALIRVSAIMAYVVIGYRPHCGAGDMLLALSPQILRHCSRVRPPATRYGAFAHNTAYFPPN